MLIVNQRKDTAVSIENVNSIQIEEDAMSHEHIITAVYKDGSFGYGLGTYEANRIKNVFREILESYKNGEKVFLMPEE